jgi:hypothetical protein
MIQFAGIESVVFCPFAKQSPYTAEDESSDFSMGRMHLYTAEGRFCNMALFLSLHLLC